MIEASRLRTGTRVTRVDPAVWRRLGKDYGEELHMNRVSTTAVRVVALLGLVTRIATAQSLVVDVRIDGATHELTRLIGARNGPGGTIIVPQPADSRFIVFSNTGTKLWVIGRKGAGPGEFQSLSNVGV